MLGESLKNRLTSPPLNRWGIFALGLVSGVAAVVTIAALKPPFLASQSPAPTAAAPARPEVMPPASEPMAVVLPPVEMGGDLATHFVSGRRLRLTRKRLEREAIADANFQRSQELALQGIATRDAGRADGVETMGELQQQEYFWTSAIGQLNQIPETSSLAATAAAKRADYETILGSIRAEITELQAAFLANIAASTGRPQAIRITICHLSGKCLDYQGDRPPTSPASLIKLPIAVVLMKQVIDEGISLDDQLYIEPHNWTENARGAKIFVDREYPLREVMVRMIKESNNIATNQLIDYLGWEYMDQTLRSLGYEQTQIRSKLIGNRTAPTRNMAVGRNVITSNEMTEMMRQIYTFEGPGAEEILDAMVGQYDWDFSYAAVNRLRNRRVAWIGEKTGQNSNVIGSSSAIKIDDERYVLTVTIDNSGNKFMLRQVISDVIQHILDNGHLVPVTRGD